MKGPTHIMFGVCAAGVTATAAGFTLPETAAICVGAVLTSRLPDQLEKLWEWIPGIGRKFHRTITHWPEFLAAIIAAMVIYLPTIMAPVVAGILTVSLFIGYGVHLIADACTVKGIPSLILTFFGKRIWLLPRHMRVSTTTHKRPNGSYEQFSKGERRARLIVCATTACVIALLLLADIDHLKASL
jgi:membrane-bound metal-dependent hydrolase YbcI (DUF457 family)